MRDGGGAFRPSPVSHLRHWSKHQSHLERKLEGADLTRFIIRLMPPVNAAEGRGIIKERTAAGTLDRRLEVITECTKIVRQSMSPASRAAMLALPAGGAAPSTTPTAAPHISH